jgi:hypothetical protein
MQRVAIGLELVLRDLQTSADEDYVTKKGNFWRLASEAANRVIEATFVALRSRGHPARNLRVLHRGIVPVRVACITTESAKDLRDWVILSNSINIVNTYRPLFNFYSESRQLRTNT